MNGEVQLWTSYAEVVTKLLAPSLLHFVYRSEQYEMI